MFTCAFCPVRHLGPFSAAGPTILSELDRLKTVRRYRAGRVLYYTDETASHVYCILLGVLKVSRLDKRGDSELATVFSPGELLGLAAGMTQPTRYQTATALTNVSACLFPSSEFFRLAQSTPELAIALAKDAQTRIAVLETELIARTHLSASERVTNLLSSLNPHLRNDLTCLSGDFHRLRRSDIAEITGLAPETVSRVLSGLRAEAASAACAGTHDQVLRSRMSASSPM